MQKFIHFGFTWFNHVQPLAHPRAVGQRVTLWQFKRLRTGTSRFLIIITIIIIIINHLFLWAMASTAAIFFRPLSSAGCPVPRYHPVRPASQLRPVRSHLRYRPGEWGRRWMSIGQWGIPKLWMVFVENPIKIDDLAHFGTPPLPYK